LFVLKQDKFLSPILLSCGVNSSCYSPNSQAMLKCLVLQFIELLIVLNHVRVQCTCRMIYNTFRYIICRVHFCSLKYAAILCKSCWWTLLNWHTVATAHTTVVLLCGMYQISSCQFSVAVVSDFHVAGMHFL
jgi:hypothetical protein